MDSDPLEFRLKESGILTSPDEIFGAREGIILEFVRPRCTNWIYSVSDSDSMSRP